MAGASSRYALIVPPTGRRPERVITMTYELAMAASRDAGSRHMRAAGRTAWNEDDWNAAVTEFDRMYPAPEPINRRSS